MAKVQKTFLLNEELLGVLEKLGDVSGHTFTRIVTAALLQYLFEGCNDPQESAPYIGPDGMWMRLAVGLEQGDLKVHEMPKTILEDNIRGCKEMLQLWADDPKRQKLVADFKERLKSFQGKLQSWENNVEDYGGASKALTRKISDRFVK